MTLAGMVGFWGVVNLEKELKESDPVEWERLTHPFEFSGRSLRHELRWIEFILLRRYARLENRRIVIFGNLVLACCLVSVAILIAWAFIPHGLGPLI
jgi:hypothetical protein